MAVFASFLALVATVPPALKLVFRSFQTVGFLVLANVGACLTGIAYFSEIVAAAGFFVLHSFLGPVHTGWAFPGAAVLGSTVGWMILVVVASKASSMRRGISAWLPKLTVADFLEPIHSGTPISISGGRQPESRSHGNARRQLETATSNYALAARE